MKLHLVGWKLPPVKAGPINLTLKFGPNQVSNSWDVVVAVGGVCRVILSQTKHWVELSWGCDNMSFFAEQISFKFSIPPCIIWSCIILASFEIKSNPQQVRAYQVLHNQTQVNDMGWNFICLIEDDVLYSSESLH